MPIYLNADVPAYLAERAAQKGIPLGEMVNTLLKQEIQIIESIEYTGPALRFAGTVEGSIALQVGTSSPR